MIMCKISNIKYIFIIKINNNHMTTHKNFELIQCQHTIQRQHCKQCGGFVTEQHKAYKTYRYITQPQYTNQRYLKSLNRKNLSSTILKQKIQISNTVFEFLQKIAQKFDFCIETFALAIYLYHHFVQISKKVDHLLKMQFYLSACLMVAAKAIQLDKNIPYFTRYQKYASSQHSSIEYQNAEKYIIQTFEFQIQIPTFITYIHFYLSNGILFSNDDFNKKKVYFLQQKVRQFMKKELRAGQFVLHDQSKYAALIILKARKQFNLQWNPLLEHYSHINGQTIQQNNMGILQPLNSARQNPNKGQTKNECSFLKKQQTFLVKRKEKISYNRITMNPPPKNFLIIHEIKQNPPSRVQM